MYVFSYRNDRVSIFIEPTLEGDKNKGSKISKMDYSRNYFDYPCAYINQWSNSSVLRSIRYSDNNLGYSP